MSRLDDLIDLIRSANDIFLSNPARNTRMAYIQVDDLAELSIKSWLQENVPNWSPRTNRRFKTFHAIANEIKQANRNRQEYRQLERLVDRFMARRTNRNRFFHDQNMSALTVTDEECLHAFGDLYALMRILFRHFVTRLRSNRIANAQVTLIRLREAAIAEGRLSGYCAHAFSGFGLFELRPGSPSHDCYAIYHCPDQFVEDVRSVLDDERDECQFEIDRIDNLQRTTRTHREKRARLVRQRDWLDRVARDFFS